MATPQGDVVDAVIPALSPASHGGAPVSISDDANGVPALQSPTLAAKETANATSSFETPDYAQMDRFVEDINVLSKVDAPSLALNDTDDNAIVEDNELVSDPASKAAVADTKEEVSEIPVTTSEDNSEAVTTNVEDKQLSKSTEPTLTKDDDVAEDGVERATNTYAEDNTQPAIEETVGASNEVQELDPIPAEDDANVIDPVKKLPKDKSEMKEVSSDEVQHAVGEEPKSDLLEAETDATTPKVTIPSTITEPESSAKTSEPTTNEVTCSFDTKAETPTGETTEDPAAPDAEVSQETFTELETNNVEQGVPVSKEDALKADAPTPSVETFPEDESNIQVVETESLPVEPSVNTETSNDIADVTKDGGAPEEVAVSAVDTEEEVAPINSTSIEEPDAEVRSQAIEEHVQEFVPESNVAVAAPTEEAKAEAVAEDSEASPALTEVDEKYKEIAAPDVEAAVDPTESDAASELKDEVVSEHAAEATSEELKEDTVAEPTAEPATVEPKDEVVSDPEVEAVPEPVAESTAEELQVEVGAVLATEELKDDVVSDPVEQVTEESKEEIAADSDTEEAKDDVTSEPVAELSVEESKDDVEPESPAETATEEPIDEMVSEPAIELATKELKDVVSESAAESNAEEPASEHVAEPVTDELGDNTVSEPVTESTKDVVPEPAAEPVTEEPKGENVSESAVELTTEEPKEDVVSTIEEFKDEVAPEPTTELAAEVPLDVAGTITEVVPEPAEELKDNMVPESVAKPAMEKPQGEVAAEEPIDEVATESTTEALYDEVVSESVAELSIDAFKVEAELAEQAIEEPEAEVVATESVIEELNNEVLLANELKDEDLSTEPAAEGLNGEVVLESTAELASDEPNEDTGPTAWPAAEEPKDEVTSEQITEEPKDEVDSESELATKEPKEDVVTESVAEPAIVGLADEIATEPTPKVLNNEAVSESAVESCTEEPKEDIPESAIELSTEGLKEELVSELVAEPATEKLEDVELAAEEPSNNTIPETAVELAIEELKEYVASEATGEPVMEPTHVVTADPVTEEPKSEAGPESAAEQATKGFKDKGLDPVADEPKDHIVSEPVAELATEKLQDEVAKLSLGEAEEDSVAAEVEGTAEFVAEEAKEDLVPANTEDVTEAFRTASAPEIEAEGEGDVVRSPETNNVASTSEVAQVSTIEPPAELTSEDVTLISIEAKDADLEEISAPATNVAVEADSATAPYSEEGIAAQPTTDLTTGVEITTPLPEDIKSEVASAVVGIDDEYSETVSTTEVTSEPHFIGKAGSLETKTSESDELPVEVTANVTDPVAESSPEIIAVESATETVPDISVASEVVEDDKPVIESLVQSGLVATVQSLDDDVNLYAEKPTIAINTDVVDSAEIDTPSLVTDTTSAAGSSARPWTPSFQVTTMGRGISPVQEVEVTDTEAENAIPAITTDAVDETVDTKPIIVTDIDANLVPPRPWTPSYSVHSQGSPLLAATDVNSTDGAVRDEDFPDVSEMEFAENPEWPPAVNTTKDIPRIESTSSQEITESESPNSPEDVTVVPALAAVNVIEEVIKKDVEELEEHEITPEQSETAAGLFIVEPVAEISKELAHESFLLTPEVDGTASENTIQDPSPAAIWIPSYSVSNQGSPLPKAVELDSPEHAELPVSVGAPKDESACVPEPTEITGPIIETPEVPKTESITDDSNVVSVLEELGSTCTLDFDATKEQPGSSSWVPSYSVSRQGSPLPDAKSLPSTGETYNASVVDVTDSSNVHVENTEVSVQPDAAIPLDFIEKPTTPVVVVTPEDKLTPVVDPVPERSKSPWTPSYSVTSQGSASPSKSAVILDAPIEVDTQATDIQVEAASIPDVDIAVPEAKDTSAFGNTPKNQIASEETTPLSAEVAMQSSISTLPSVDENAVSDAPSIVLEPTSTTRKRLESTTSSRFFPGGWFSNSPKVPDGGRTSLEIAQGEFTSSKAVPTDDVSDIVPDSASETSTAPDETEETEKEKKSGRWCVIM